MLHRVLINKDTQTHTDTHIHTQTYRHTDTHTHTSLTKMKDVTHTSLTKNEGCSEQILAKSRIQKSIVNFRLIQSTASFEMHN